VLPYCHANNIGVIAYSPMGSGLLTGAMTRERVAALPADDWRTRAPQFQEPALTKNLALQEKLVELGGRHDRTAAETALAWVLKHEAITGAIVGIRRADQVDGVIEAMRFRITDAEAAEIEAVLA
jgi:aryl-alcohol dehydrogenase-like predicted oxidoreductase